MKLSVIYSIYNRTKLFERGLQSVLKQSMGRGEFELVVVDDNSTEDVRGLLGQFGDKLRIRYIRYDRKLHPIWQELNPNGVEQTWYHTQAISANIGINYAEGDICAIIQPEMILSPHTFQTGYDQAVQAKQIFGEIVRSTPAFNDYLDNFMGSWWDAHSFDSLLAESEKCGREWNFAHLPDQGHYDMYWYIEFFPRAYARHINGVDLAYQAGVYAEDDQFKVRMRMAECAERWAGRPHCDGPVGTYIVGIHQSHDHEKESDKKQDRDADAWNRGAERNRTLWRLFNAQPYLVANQNLPYSPWGEFTVQENYIL